MTLVLSRFFFHFQKHDQLFNLCSICSVELLNNPLSCKANNSLKDQQIFKLDMYIIIQTHAYTRQMYTCVLWSMLIFNMLLTMKIITQIIYFSVIGIGH